MSYPNVWKRVFDFAIALLLLALAGPLILLASMGIKFSSRGPVFFRQERVGLNGMPFSILKLRTMHINVDRKISQTYNNDPEVFPFGRVLRRLKIDELPQIFNVVKGDMSFVGPRPCLMHTYIDMPEWARKRALVRPGITGMAQISGNVALTWEERWRHDVRYVESVSLVTDIRLLLKTVAVVVLGEERFKEVL